ncbi:methyltransferase domain-containing protein [Colletotrichum tofieldiae]|nr:methyltransferase domain-containing protein [Colletotrichum tofieldiae]
MVDDTMRSDQAFKGPWRWAISFPTQRVPPNVKFEIDDVESEWVNDHKYDFIFSRYMNGSLADWPTYMKRVYEYIFPQDSLKYIDD